MQRPGVQVNAACQLDMSVAVLEPGEEKVGERRGSGSCDIEDGSYNSFDKHASSNTCFELNFGVTAVSDRRMACTQDD